MDLIFETRAEADKYMRALNHVQKVLVARIGAIERKNSWRESEKAMALVIDRQSLESISWLNEAIKSANRIGGY